NRRVGSKTAPTRPADPSALWRATLIKKACFLFHVGHFWDTPSTPVLVEKQQVTSVKREVSHCPTKKVFGPLLKKIDTFPNTGCHLRVCALYVIIFVAFVLK